MCILLLLLLQRYISPILHLRRTRRNEPLRIRFFRPPPAHPAFCHRSVGRERPTMLRSREREREAQHCNSQPRRPIKLTYCLLACLLHYILPDDPIPFLSFARPRTSLLDSTIGLYGTIVVVHTYTTVMSENVFC